jgi:AcrR family transcriptional regulator
MSQSAPLNPRKSPKQQRSRATVEAILEATARVLVEDGFAKTSTNRIAKVAGVSVGSLYQYFPSKQSLVMALCERHCEQMLTLLGEMSLALLDAPLPLAVRTWVRKMLDVHRVDPALHQALVHLALHMGLENLQHFDRRGRELVRAYLARRADEILPTDLDLAAFVLVTCVETLTHRFILDFEGDDIPWEALEDEICAVVLRYLIGHSGDCD